MKNEIMKKTFVSFVLLTSDLDDVLEKASAARYQMFPKKSKLRYQKELERFAIE
jgi:hypothetical protein